MPRAYEWDYEHSSCDSNPLYDTFSVPVFQWLPNASGKGLKRSKTIRVNGYTANPQTAYDKAAELVRQLNDAGVRIENPPKWLQKTYSVPKPFGVVIPRTNDELPPGQVRTIRERVARQRLLPAGFVKGADATYVRRRGEQIHLIYFHAYGQALGVHLSFHFTFIPPLSAVKPIPLNAFRQIDCGCQASIGSFISDTRGFCYGHDPDALHATLTSAANLAVAILDRYGNDWNDPAAVLAEINGERQQQQRQWEFHDCEIVAACILARLGRSEEGKARLRALRAKWPDDWHIAALADALETPTSDWVLPATAPTVTPAE
jgi:hypothetical protein